METVINNNDKRCQAMRSTFPLAILASSLITATVTHADQTANDQTYRVCNVSGCQTSLINQTVNRMEEYTKTQYPIVLVHGINGYAEQVFKDKKTTRCKENTGQLFLSVFMKVEQRFLWLP